MSFDYKIHNAKKNLSIMVNKKANKFVIKLFVIVFFSRQSQN